MYQRFLSNLVQIFGCIVMPWSVWTLFLIWEIEFFFWHFNPYESILPIAMLSQLLCASFFLHFNMAIHESMLPIDSLVILPIYSRNHDLSGLHFYALYFPTVQPAPPRIDAPQSPLRVAEDTTESISCIVSAARPKASIQWFLEEENLTLSSQQEDSVSPDVSTITLLAC